MLGKLLKHEFRSNGRMMGLMVICALFVAGIASLSYALGIAMFQVTATLVMFLAIAGVVVFALIVVTVRFFKSMYGREGYLTMTLPVSSTTLLSAKMIVSLVWLVLSAVLSLGMFFLLFFLAYTMEGSENFFQQIFYYIQQIGVGTIVQSLVFFGITMLISMILFLSQMFFAVTLANTAAFQRYSIVSAVFLFLGIGVAMGTLESILTIFLPIGVRFTLDGLQVVGENMMGMATIPEQQLSTVIIGIGGQVFRILEIAGLFIGTSQLIKRKLCLR